MLGPLNSPWTVVVCTCPLVIVASGGTRWCLRVLCNSTRKTQQPAMLHRAGLLGRSTIDAFVLRACCSLPQQGALQAAPPGSECGSGVVWPWGIVLQQPSDLEWLVALLLSRLRWSGVVTATPPMMCHTVRLESAYTQHSICQVCGPTYINCLGIDYRVSLKEGPAIHVLAHRQKHPAC